VSEQTIDSEHSKPAPETAKRKRTGKTARKARATKKVSRAKKLAESGSHQQEGRGHRNDEAGEGVRCFPKS